MKKNLFLVIFLTFVLASNAMPTAKPAVSEKLIKKASFEINIEKPVATTDTVNNYLKGVYDATVFYNKTGLYLILGFIFGIFAFIGVLAFSFPTPFKSRRTMMFSKNKELFGNPEYLAGYRKKARAKNIMAVALGWLLFIAFWLIIIA